MPLEFQYPILESLARFGSGLEPTDGVVQLLGSRSIGRRSGNGSNGGRDGFGEPDLYRWHDP